MSFITIVISKTSVGKKIYYFILSKNQEQKHTYANTSHSFTAKCFL